MKQIKTYADLLQRKEYLETEKVFIEKEIHGQIRDLAHSGNWFVSGIKLLGSTFKDDESSPFIAITEGIIHLYREFKGGKIDPDQSIIEHFIELLKGHKEPHKATHKKADKHSH